MAACAITAVVLSSLVLLPACSASDGNDPASVTTTVVGRGDIPVGTWSIKFCTEFDAWLGALDAERARVGARLNQRDLAAARTAVVDLFARSRGQTDEFVVRLDELGAPRVERGVPFVAALRRNFTAFREAMDDASTAARKLSSRDPAGLQLGLAALVNDYEAAMNRASQALAELDRPGLAPDLRDGVVAACSS